MEIPDPTELTHWETNAEQIDIDNSAPMASEDANALADPMDVPNV
jgi:hypothetical protein